MGWTRDQVIATLALVVGAVGAFPVGKDIYFALSLTSGEPLAGNWFCRGACGDGSFDTQIIMVGGKPYFKNTSIATAVPGTIDHANNTITVPAWGLGGIGTIEDSGNIIVWNLDNNIWTQSRFSKTTLIALGFTFGAVLAYGFITLWRLFGPTSAYCSVKRQTAFYHAIARIIT